MRRSALLIVAGLVLAAGSVAADPKKPSRASARRTINDKGTMRQCSERSGKKACRRVAVFQGHGASQAALRDDPLDQPSGDVWLRAENLGEEFKGNIYKADGSFDDNALAKLD